MDWEQSLKKWEDGITRDQRRRQGSIWTPPDLSSLMADWLGHPRAVFDPAAGSGNLLAPFSGADIFAAETDPVLRSVLNARFKNVNLYTDFWDISLDTVFPAITANPPYIQGRLIQNRDQVYEQTDQVANLPRSTNLALLFYLKSYHLLAPLGRMVFLIPTEFMQIKSGFGFKDFLLKNGGLKEIVEIDDGELFGPGVISTACLVMAEKSNNSQFFFFKKISGPKDSFRELLKQKVSKKDIDPRRRWVIGADQQKPVGTRPFSDYAEIKPGHVTGNNEFFIKSKKDIDQLGLQSSYILLQMKGFKKPYLQNDSDIKDLELTDQKRFLITIGEKPNSQEKRYLSRGLKTGVNKTPSFKNRDPWWEQKFVTGADFVLPNFRRGDYKPFGYIEKGRLTPMPFPTIQNLVILKPEFKKLNELFFLFFLSRKGQKALRSNERHAGNGLFTIRSGAIKEILMPDFSKASDSDLKKSRDLFSDLEKGVDKDSFDIDQVTGVINQFFEDLF